MIEYLDDQSLIGARQSSRSEANEPVANQIADESERRNLVI